MAASAQSKLPTMFLPRLMTGSYNTGDERLHPDDRVRVGGLKGTLNTSGYVDPGTVHTGSVRRRMQHEGADELRERTRLDSKRKSRHRNRKDA